MGWPFNREAPKDDSINSPSIFYENPFQRSTPSPPPRPDYPVVGEVVEHVERSFSQSIDPDNSTTITATTRGYSLTVTVQKYSLLSEGFSPFEQRSKSGDPTSIYIPTSAIPELIALLQTMQTVSSIKTKEDN